MRRSYIACYLAVVLPALAATPEKSDWARLAQLAATQTVKVHLRDGRTLTGSILEFRANGLTFLEDRKVTRIRPSRITRATVTEMGQVVKVIEGNPHLQAGQTVELALSDGRALSGRVREVDYNDDSLKLVESRAAEQVAREDVLRVTRNRRAKSAKIGAIGGAALMVGLAAAGPKDSLKPGEGAGAAWAGLLAGGALIGAGLGAAIGAGIGYPETLYRAPTP